MQKDQLRVNEYTLQSFGEINEKIIFQKTFFIKSKTQGNQIKTKKLVKLDDKKSLKSRLRKLLTYILNL